MDYKKFGDKYVVRLDKGEEIVETLKKLCEAENIKAGFIKGIGAADRAVVGVLNTDTNEFNSVELTGDHEITSLIGNISSMNGEVYLHLHINLADKEYNTRGGHLSSAVISAVGEIIIETMDGPIEREFDEARGINIYRF